MLSELLSAGIVHSGLVICSHALCVVDLLLHICDTWFDAKGLKVAETLKYLQCNA